LHKGRGDAVIVIDMVKGFHNTGSLANERTVSIIPGIRDLLIRKSKKEGCLTVFLQDSHKRGDPEFKVFPEHCLEGTEEAETIDELQEFLQLPNARVVTKRTYNGCYATKLGPILQTADPARVIVVGVCTDICVKYTVAGLTRERGYSVVVPADCVETFHDEFWHDAEAENANALLHMRKMLGATIVSGAYKI